MLELTASVVVMVERGVKMEAVVLAMKRRLEMDEKIVATPA